MKKLPGPSKGCPMDYPTLLRDLHWTLLGWSWYAFLDGETQGLSGAARESGAPGAAGSS